MGTIEDTLLAMKQVIDKRSYNLPKGEGLTLVDKLKGLRKRFREKHQKEVLTHLLILKLELLSL